MSRVARQVIPHVPHYIVQRGNRNQDVFFGEEDYRAYLSLLRAQAADGEIRIHAYCLLPNQVHLLVTPRGDSLRMVGEANRRYACHINRKMAWEGHLWAGRFASQPMDEQGTNEAVAALEVSPVQAGICAHPAQYRWSSARQLYAKARILSTWCTVNFSTWTIGKAIGRKRCSRSPRGCLRVGKLCGSQWAWCSRKS